MTQRQFVDKNGNTWEWEETDEVRKAVERLHADIRKLEKEAPDYGVGK
jgi:ubiquinone biosynthesis protein UbiJ